MYSLLNLNRNSRMRAVSSINSLNAHSLTRPHPHAVRRKVIIISNCRLVPYWREFLGVSGSQKRVGPSEHYIHPTPANPNCTPSTPTHCSIWSASICPTTLTTCSKSSINRHDPNLNKSLPHPTRHNTTAKICKTLQTPSRPLPSLQPP